MEIQCDTHFQLTQSLWGQGRENSSALLSQGTNQMLPLPLKPNTQEDNGESHCVCYILR